jgi:hypothetical protein
VAVWAGWLRFGESRGKGWSVAITVRGSWFAEVGEGWRVTPIERTAYPQFKPVPSPYAWSLPLPGMFSKLDGLTRFLAPLLPAPHVLRMASSSSRTAARRATPSA